jgi:hypothetical protein
MDLEDNTTEWTISGKAIPDESIKKIRTLSRQLENDLVELYKSADESDLSWFRAQLEKSISAVATIASKLALQGEIDLMSGFPADTSELAVEMAEKVDAAKKNARAYVAKIYRKMKSDDSISERAAFRGRLELGEGLFQARPTLASDDPMNPYRLAQAERGLVIRLENLIDEIACVRDRKG